MLDNGNNNGMYMPVAPAYGGYGNNGFGFGGDWGWIILLLLCAGGGWGFGGMGGYGGFGGYDFPWILNGQNQINNNTNNGFRDAMLNDGINGIRDAITGGFATAESSANARQIADMQQNFALQSQFANCCCENRLGIADLKYTVATENCADRAAVTDGIRDVIASQTAATQKILDKLCDQEIQAERRDNANLRSELMYARGQASQVEQTARILAGQAAEIDGVYNRLKNCPVGTYSVCNPLTPAGCGCSGNTFFN